MTLTEVQQGSIPPASANQIEEVRAWLEQASLEHYVDIFIKEKISVQSLPYLEESHLKELGLSVGDRVKFKMSVDAMKRNPSSPTIGPSASVPQDNMESPKGSPESGIIPPTTKSSSPVSVPTHKRTPSEKQMSASAPVHPAIPNAKSKSGTINTPTGSPAKAVLDRSKSNSTNSPLKKAPPTSPPPVASSSAPPAEVLVQDVEEYQCKVVVIGPPATGKTSLVRRYTHGTFERGYKQTIGVDFEVKTIPWNSNITIHVQLWDIAGQERFSAVVPQFYRSAAAALVVFDVTDEATLQSALRWNEHFQKNEIQQSGKNIPVMLIANKADLLEGRQLPDFDELAKTHNFVKWWLTSAKTNQGINEAINFLIENILSDNGIDTKEPPKDTVNLAKPANTKQKQNTSCCS